VRLTRGGCRLQRFFSSFPEGWPGIGLIFLRLTVALNVITQGIFAIAAASGPALAPWFIGIVAIVIGVALLAGCLTPIAGVSATIGYLAMGVSDLPANAGGAFLAFDLTAISIALILLGPGAFSLDAILFGRREIIIPDGRRPLD